MTKSTLYTPINPHFFQPILPGFKNHLDMPIAFFLKHLEGRNKGKTAKLRSDASEEITWKVKMDGRKFSDGWGDFAVAHDLRVGDIVVFRHEGELLFHVSGLGPSCCEIQYGEEEEEEEKLCETENFPRKKKSPETETDSSTDQSCFVLTVTASNLRRDIVYLPKTFGVVNGLMKKLEIVLINEEGESSRLDLRHEAYSGRFYMSKGWRSFCVANRKEPGDLFRFKLVENQETPLLQVFPLDSEDLHKFENFSKKKRQENEADSPHVPKKKRQENQADSSPDHSCFVAIVTASNLRRDEVYLPKKFGMSNGLMKKLEIDLVNEKGESWTIDFRQEAYSGRFVMRRGWRSFCVANGKKPGDLFRFKLVENEETPVLQMLPLNLCKVEPSNDTRQGLEATEKEFLGIEANRNVIRQGSCSKGSNKDYLPSAEPTNEASRKGKCSEAIGTTIKEENITTSQNRFVTLTLTPTSFIARRLNLPLEFTKGNGIKKAGKIKMLDRYGTKWLTTLYMDKNKRGTMSLGRNWRGFCEVNGVKMDESFVLELVWEDRVPVLKFCSKC